MGQDSTEFLSGAMFRLYCLEESPVALIKHRHCQVSPKTMWVGAQESVF